MSQWGWIGVEVFEGRVFQPRVVVDDRNEG